MQLSARSRLVPVTMVFLHDITTLETRSNTDINTKIFDLDHSPYLVGDRPSLISFSAYPIHAQDYYWMTFHRPFDVANLIDNVYFFSCTLMSVRPCPSSVDERILSIATLIVHFRTFDYHNGEYQARDCR